jgi:hypothetical protein
MEYFTSIDFRNCCIQILYEIKYGGRGVPLQGNAYPFQNVITSPPATIKLPPTRIGVLGD